MTWKGPSPTPGWRGWWPAFPLVSRRCSASEGRGCRRESASGWHWPERSFADAPLLLLDEPTANLDGDTEADVLDAVRRLASGRTVVLVAHRPALLALADRVVELMPAGVAS